MDIVKKAIDYGRKIPKSLRLIIVIILFLSLFFTANRIIYRVFEGVFFLFIIIETGDILSGSLLFYLLFSTIEVGKNFSKIIVRIPIHFLKGDFYLREYQAAFVFLDTDFLLIFIFLFLGRLYTGRGGFVSKIRSFRKKMVSFDLFLLSFFLIISLSTIFSVNFDNSYLGFLQVLRGMVVFYLFRFIDIKKIKSYLPRIFSSILIFQSCLGIVQYFKKGPVGAIFETGRYLHPNLIHQKEGLYTFFRSVGTFTEPNLYGLILNMLIPLTLIFYFYERNRSKKIFFGSGFILGTSAVLFSLSRMAWFLYFINLLFLLKLYPEGFILEFQKGRRLFLRSRRFRWYFLTGLGLIMIFYLTKMVPRIENIKFSISQTWGSFNARLFLIKEAFKIISLYPLLGVGLFNFVPVMVRLTKVPKNVIYLSSVHNIYLLLASEIGLMGVIIFLFFLKTLICRYLKLRKRRRIGKDKFLLDSLSLAVWCFFFGGLFLSYFYAGIQFVFLMVILGIYGNILSLREKSVKNSQLISQ